MNPGEKSLHGYKAKRLNRSLAKALRQMANKLESSTASTYELERDTAALKRAEQDSRESEVRFRILLEGTPVSILVANVQTKSFTYANPAGCKMLGYTEEELMGMTLMDIHRREDLEYVLSEFAAQARGEKTLVRNIPFLRKDGTIADADVNSTNILLDGQECNVCFMTDVTALRQAEEKSKRADEELRKTQYQLMQADKLTAIGELAAGVAHELNQPLMVIRTTAQLMARKQHIEPLNTGALLESLNIIEDNTKRMMNIINHLRTFSRQAEGVLEPVNVNTVIESSFMMIGEQLRVRSIEVVLELSNDLPKVLVNANQLGQVFLNLLTNARDALESKENSQEEGAKPQKRIVITTRVSDDAKEQVEILYRDNGSGIPQANLNKVFDPFFTTKAAGKGTGLGLSISYGIIEDHEGKIDVVETGPEGTTFRIRLPGM